MRKRNIITAIIAVIMPVTFLAFSAPVALAQGSSSGLKCGGADTSIISCNGTGQDAILGIVKMVIRIMTGGVLVVATGAVVVGAIMYTSSGSNPENVKKAKSLWMNTLIGLLLFGFMAAITNFIIPGGVFS